ncbi:MAG: KR domain-containing protein [Anaerolineales bacterium]|nr:KR domain-containing protein [Anaerolineales bacterium]
MPEIQNINHIPDENTLFLVTGGGKGITAENAIALARTFHSRFLLLGRSPLLSAEPPWAVGVETDQDLKKNALEALSEGENKPTPREINRETRRVQSSREIRNTLQRIAKAGGQGTYLSADITDPESLRGHLAPYLDQINGMLHGAGALADKYISEKEEEDFELVYGVKVDGLRNLLDLIPADQLDYLILFSSVAGFYGNSGQADYSLGNEVLNKYAHYLANNGVDTQVFAVDWGPWDGGMVTPQLKRIFARRNVQVIPLEQGTQTLVDLLSNNGAEAQFVVGSPLPYPPLSPGERLKTHQLRRQLAVKNNPFLQDHVIGGKAVLPTVSAVGWMVNGCEALYPGYQFFQVDDYRAYKGIIFDGSLADQHTLELIEQEKSPDSIRFQARIWSLDNQDRQLNHYQARVELRRSSPERPVLDAYNLEPTSATPGADLYQENTLFHGPRFRGVQEILNHSREGITLRCRGPRVTRVDQGQFPVRSFNPFLADIHLQSLLIWSSLYLDVKGLPLRIAGGKQYRQLEFGETSYATMKVLSTSKHKLTADVISHDQEGRIYSIVNEAEITLSDRLNSLFLENQLREVS